MTRIGFKGLRRHGMRSYKLKCWIITRDRPWRWWVRHESMEGMPMDFFAVKHSTLKAAAIFASDQVIYHAPIVSRKLKQAKHREKLAHLLADARKDQSLGPE